MTERYFDHVSLKNMKIFKYFFRVFFLNNYRSEFPGAHIISWIILPQSEITYRICSHSFRHKILKRTINLCDVVPQYDKTRRDTTVLRLHSSAEGSRLRTLSEFFWVLSLASFSSFMNLLDWKMFLEKNFSIILETSTCKIFKQFTHNSLWQS